MTYWFAVGQLSCAVVSDGQMEPPLAPPLEAFFTPGTGVPDRDLREALAAEGQGRTMVKCGYNCLLVDTPDGRLDCRTRCSVPYRRGTIRRLTAEPADHYLFTRWSGDCIGTAPTCDVALSLTRWNSKSPKTVTTPPASCRSTPPAGNRGRM